MAGKKRPNTALAREKGSTGSSSTPLPNKKAKVAKKAKDVEKVKAVDAAKLRAAIDTAVRDNPPGVRVVAMGSFDMTPLLAGYLNLADTQALRDFINQVTDSDPCQAWLDARKVGFGVNGLNTTSIWAVKTLFKFASDPGFLTDEDFQHGLPMDTKRWPTKDSTRGYASWLVTMHTIIQAYPENFPSTANDQTDSDYLAGIHAEDWHRA